MTETKPLVIETRDYTTTIFPPDRDGDVEIRREAKRFSDDDAYVFINARHLHDWLTAALSPAPSEQED